MRTARRLTISGGGGGLPPVGGGVCLVRGICLAMVLWEGRIPCEQTNTCENITFPQLHLWVVTIDDNYLPSDC